VKPLAVRLGLVGAAVLAGAVAGVVVLATRDSGDAGRNLPRAGILVQAGIEPRVHAFGDPTAAEVVLLVDPTQVVVNSVRIEADFDPYEVAGAVHTERAESSSVARLRFRYPLTCLTEACAPGEATPMVDLDPGRVVFRVRSRATPTIREFDWPPITLVSRVGPEALAQGRWRADAATVPEPDYRVAPGGFAAGLLSASVALVVAVVGLAAYRLARRRAVRAEEVVDSRPPLERAVELALLVSRNGDPAARRTALERVARELIEVGRNDLATRMRTLAWSPEPPSADAVEEVVRAAEAEPGDKP
jgi:hypothetical protein